MSCNAHPSHQQLLESLLTEPLPEPVVIPARRLQRRPCRTWSVMRSAGAALLIGGALSLSSGAATVAAAPALRPSVAFVTSDILRSPGYAATPAAVTGAAVNGAAGLKQRAMALVALANAELRPGVELHLPALPVGPDSIAGQTGGNVYVVRSGDTLSAIALRAYGNANLWPTIYNANRAVIGENPNLIFPNQSLNIPVAQQSPTPPATAQGQQSPTTPASQHTVVSGDTLSSIAQRFYGNAGLWPTIYNANLNTIGNNPGLIIPGQNLTIPAR